MQNNSTDSNNSSFFTYVFDEEIDRVYYSFTNPSIFSDIFLSNFVTSKNFSKLINLDENDKEYSMSFQNTHELIFKIKKNPNPGANIKEYIHETISVNGNAKTKIFSTYTFIWNTSEHSTLFINQVRTEPEEKMKIVSQMFNNIYKSHGCERLSLYLKSSSFRLAQLESVHIENSFLKVFQILSNSKTILPTILLCDLNETKGITIQGGFNSLGTIFTVYEKNNPNKVVMVLSLKNFQITEEKIKFLLESKKINDTPMQNIQVLIESLNQNNCLLLVKHIFLEYIPCKTICDLGKKKRTTLKTLKTKLCE